MSLSRRLFEPHSTPMQDCEEAVPIEYHIDIGSSEQLYPADSADKPAGNL